MTRAFLRAIVSVMGIIRKEAYICTEIKHAKSASVRAERKLVSLKADYGAPRTIQDQLMLTAGRLMSPGE